MKRALLTVVLCVALMGCKMGAHSLLGVPVPLPADAVCSVESYNKKYGIDVYSQTDYDLSNKADEIRHANALANKITSRIVVAGQRMQTEPDFAEVRNSKKIANNLYEVKCEQKVKFEQQKDNTSCWAACAQYLKLRRSGKYLTQDEIVEKYQTKGVSDSSGTPQDMISTMGVFGYSFAQEDAYGVVNALAHNEPIVFGIDQEGTDVDHMVVVIGARYSFAAGDITSLGKHYYAFTSFDVLDPDDGKIHVVPATQYDGKVLFTLYYHPTIFGIF